MHRVTPREGSLKAPRRLPDCHTGHRNRHQLDFLRKLRAVLDETTVGAPAVRSRDGLHFVFHRFGRECAADIEVVIVQVADDTAHLAGTESAVVVDYDRALAGGAGHGP